MSDFGVIVVCYKDDYYLAKGCCASIRYFMPDAPICLLVDGDVDTTDLERTYSVETIRRRDVSHPELRERSFGWGLTKMVAFWESPWTHYMAIDADMIVWGDMLRYAQFDRFDIVTDRHIHDVFGRAAEVTQLDLLLNRHALADDPKYLTFLNNWYFNLGLLSRRYPDFPWNRVIGRLFCPGVYFAKRGIIPVEAYLDILNAARDAPGLFAAGDMGLLNFLVFRGEARQEIRVGQDAGLHTLVYRHDAAELVARFPIGADGKPAETDRAGAVHWSGWPKPTVLNPAQHSAAMTFFRQKFLLDRGYSRWQAGGILIAEDLRRKATFHGSAAWDSVVSKMQSRAA